MSNEPTTDVPPREKSERDWTVGDVVAAYTDGTIVLDDGLTTWNDIRAQEFLTKQGEAPQWCFEAAIGVVGLMADGKANPEDIASRIWKHAPSVCAVPIQLGYATPIEQLPIVDSEKWAKSACCKGEPRAIYYNPDNRVIQCHQCGHVYEPKLRADSVPAYSDAEKRAKEIVGFFTLELGPRVQLPQSALDGLRTRIAAELAVPAVQPHQPECRIYEAAPGMRDNIPCTCAFLIHEINAHPLMECLSEAMQLIAVHPDDEVSESWHILHRLRKQLRAHLESHGADKGDLG